MSELLKINVNEHVEKKNGLSYLSWAWAWAEVLKQDPLAHWRLADWGQHAVACFLPDGSAMVGVSVTIKGDTKVCYLPVMNHRNQAIKNPDAFAVNTAIMRCLAKGIAMHGLGLYIYAGEDSLVPALEASIAAVKAMKEGDSGKPLDGAGRGLSDERKAELEELTLDLINMKNNGHFIDACAAYYAIPDNDEKVYVWKLLAAESKFRAELKANSPHKQPKKEPA